MTEKKNSLPTLAKLTNNNRRELLQVLYIEELIALNRMLILWTNHLTATRTRLNKKFLN